MGFLSCNSESSVSFFSSSTEPRNQKKKTRERSNRIREFSYEELESATAGFSNDYLLGGGSHGSVYKAIVDGGKLVVAVKKPKATKAEEKANNNSPGENEIEVLSRIWSPGFVNLLGFSLGRSDRKLIVVEFMANGTLYDHLHCRAEPPRWAQRISLSLQTAEAVLALHSSDPPVIHRDIKSSNVLIDENWNARLGDFGLALRGYVEDVRVRSTPPAGTLGYIDPGYIEPEDLSTKSDVFSFGILLLEILSGRNAIDVNYSPSSVVDWALPLIKNGEFEAVYDTRIGAPSNAAVGRQLAVLAGCCVGPSVRRRPSMRRVVGCLREVNKTVCSPFWTSFRDWMWRGTRSIGGELVCVEEEGGESETAAGLPGRSLLRNRKVSNAN
ncbi:hypothetical protein ACLOJK_013544 [Asimina triloba]